eukprot:snap_masked-scaffold_62-processed-gene-0.46-mRNA-1 protein AED:1.00 eAED:1.00 QI:0/-1/0/0/-1/1/1/0/119
MAKSRMLEVQLRSSKVDIHRLVIQGDNLSHIPFISCLNYLIEIIWKDALGNISLNSQNMQLMTFLNGVVAFYKRPEQVQDLIFQLRRIEASSGLRSNIKKTRVMKIERSIEVNEEIPRE